MGSVEIGLGLAIFAAVMANLAALLKHRGCQRIAPVEILRPLESARRLARSRWFAAGWGLAAAAWLVHVAALSMAPISLVQTILAAGAFTLAIMSQGLFGDPVTRRQWLALLLGGAGLALLVLTVPDLSDGGSGFSLLPILAFEGGLVVLAGVLALGHRSDRLTPRSGVLPAALSGTLFAFAGIAIKALTGADGLSLAVVLPWACLILLCGILAQYSAVVALQSGGPIETIGVMGLVANAMQISAGVLVFGDPVSASPLGLATQACAFAMVCLAALLLSAGEPAAKARVEPRLA